MSVENWPQPEIMIAFQMLSVYKLFASSYEMLGDELHFHQVKVE